MAVVIRVLGLLGSAGVGKSSVAAHMATHYGATRMSIAGPLKQIARDVMGFSDAQLWGTQAEKDAVDPLYGFSARTFLQRLGTDGVRKHLGDHIWMDALFAQIRRNTGANPHRKHLYVIDDLRFRSEVRAIYDVAHSVHGAQGYVFHLMAPLHTGPSTRAHLSEVESLGIMPSEVNADIVSDASLGLADLFAKVRHQWERVAGRPTSGSQRYQPTDRNCMVSKDGWDRECTHLECGHECSA